MKRPALPALVAKRERAAELARTAPVGTRTKRRLQLFEATHQQLAAEVRAMKRGAAAQ